MSTYRSDGEIDQPVVVAHPTEPVAPVQPAYVEPPAYLEPTAVAPRVVAPAAPVVVAEPPVVATDSVVQRSVFAFSASQIVHGIAAIVLLVIGAVVVATGGFDDPISQQVGSFLGIEMTTPVGLFVLAAGLLLVIAALTPSGRPFGGFVGAVIAVGGIIVIAANPDVTNDLRADDAMGWILLVLGICCVVAAFLPDELRSRRRQVVVR